MTGSRRAIVNPMAGTTRDSLSRPVEWRGVSFQLFDTGGLYGASLDPLHELVVKQGQRAIVGADLVVFVCDAREGLESLIKTYRTLESGLIYETRPPNPYAAEIQEALKQTVDELRKRLAENSGMQTLRDADVLGALVFLQRLELQHNNGRRRGRAFVDFLRAYFPAQTQPAVAS